MEKPADSEYEIDGSYYKIGAHNFVYWRNNSHWANCSRNVFDLTMPRKKQRVNNKRSLRA